MFRLINKKNKEINNGYEKPKREWQDDFYNSISNLRNDIKKLGLEDGLHKFNYDNDQLHIKLNCLVTLTQEVACNRINSEVTLTGAQVEYLYRGIIDMLNHLPNELPDGVYSYMYTKMSVILIDILKQLSK